MRPRTDQRSLLRRKGSRARAVVGAVLFAAALGWRGAYESKRRPLVSGCDGRRAPACRVADRLVGGRAAGNRTAPAHPAGRGVDRARARNRRRGDPGTRDARASVLDAALRARARRRLRVPLLLLVVPRQARRGCGCGRRPRGCDRSATRDPGRAARPLCDPAGSAAAAAGDVRRRRARRATAALCLRHLGIRQSASPRLRRHARPRCVRRLAGHGVLRARRSELSHSRRAAAEPARTARAHAGRRGGRRRLRSALASRPPLGGRIDRRARARRARLELGAASRRVRARRLVAGTALSDPAAAVPLLRARAGAAARAGDRRRARADLYRCDGGRDERRAVAAERRHAPLAVADRARQLRRHRRQPWRGRTRLARDRAVLCARARRGGGGDSRDAAAPVTARPRNGRRSRARVDPRRARRTGAPARRPPRPRSWGLLAAIGLVAAAVWAVLRLRPEGLLLVPFATVRFDDHTKWALLLALLALAALALHGRVRRTLGPA